MNVYPLTNRDDQATLMRLFADGSDLATLPQTEATRRRIARVAEEVLRLTARG